MSEVYSVLEQIRGCNVTADDVLDFVFGDAGLLWFGYRARHSDVFHTVFIEFLQANDCSR